LRKKIGLIPALLAETERNKEKHPKKRKSSDEHRSEAVKKYGKMFHGGDRLYS
jgi:hypothetical protein